MSSESMPASTSSSPGEEPVRRTPLARGLRGLLALGFGLVLALGVCEAGFRYLLFSDSGFALKYGAKFRDANAFSNSKAHSDYFKLRFLWREAAGQNRGFHNTDPRLGWVKSQVRRPDLDHQHRTRVGKRRPFLMYGDSFTACTTPQKDCWEGLIETSFLGPHVCVINYGVRGYGVDQMKALLDETIDLWKDQDPVVAVGILADDDLDRVVFEFRQGPKPHFDLEDGELVPNYPGEYEDIASWVDQNPPEVTSYLLRYLTVGAKLLPESFAEEHFPEGEALVKRKKVLSAALITSMRDRLEEAGVDYFFIIFEGPFVKRGERFVSKQTWRIQFLKLVLDELEIPWVSSTRAVLEHQREHERTGNAGYFVPDGKPDARHFTPLGNEAALNAILRGLHGSFDGEIRELDRHPRHHPKDSADGQ